MSGEKTVMTVMYSLRCRVKDAYPEEEDFVDDQLDALQNLWEKLQVSCDMGMPSGEYASS